MKESINGMIGARKHYSRNSVTPYRSCPLYYKQIRRSQRLKQRKREKLRDKHSMGRE